MKANEAIHKESAVKYLKWNFKNKICSFIFAEGDHSHWINILFWQSLFNLEYRILCSSVHISIQQVVIQGKNISHKSNKTQVSTTKHTSGKGDSTLVIQLPPQRPRNINTGPSKQHRSQVWQGTNYHPSMQHSASPWETDMFGLMATSQW